MRFIQEITVGHQSGYPTGTVFQGKLIESDKYEQTIETAEGKRITVKRQHMITSRPVRIR